MQTFLQFTRPHTIISTTLQVLLAYFFVLKSFTGLYSEHALLVLGAWISSVSLNIYVVGFNQLIDLDIDKINKPFLPLASGELSRKAGLAITGVMAILALITSAIQGWYLFATISFIFIIGTIYSMPSTYLKGSPLGAALAIGTSRGLVSNIGVYLYFHQAIFGSASLPFHVLAFAFFCFGFGIAIALMKDIPDLDGDKQFGVQTLSVKLGVGPVLFLGLLVLTLAYSCLTLAAIYDFSFYGSTLLLIAHSIVLSYLWIKRLSVDYSKKESTYEFYMIVWNFFYIEYGLFSLCSYLGSF